MNIQTKVAGVVIVGALCFAAGYTVSDRSVGVWKQKTREAVTVAELWAEESKRTTRELQALTERYRKLEEQSRSSDNSEEIHTEERPDGTRVSIVRRRQRQSETTRKDETAEKTQTQEKTQQEVQVQIREKVVEKIVEKEAVKRFRRDWILGAQAGIGLREFSGRRVVGVSVDRRLLGPIYGGLWGNSAGMVGVGLKLEF